MNRSIVKPILVGVLFGAALFFIPFFILRVAAFLVIAGIVFRLFGRRSGAHFNARRFAFADNVRNMSDEEYNKFKEQASYGCGVYTKQQSTTN